MLKNLYNQKLFLPYIKYFIILLLFWGSLNTGSKYFLINYSEKNDFVNFTNLLRAILPYFIIFYFFLINYKFKKTNFLKFDLILKLFVIYGLLQISGLLYLNDNLHQHYWVVCLFSLIIFYNSIEKKNSEDLINFILFANILIAAIFFLFFTFLAFNENLLSKDIIYQGNSLIAEFAKERTPRSTGLSRMGLLIFIFLNAIYFSNCFKNFKNYIILFVNILIITILLLFQSRGIVISYILIFLGINFLYKFKNLKHRFNFFLLMVIVPLIIFIIYPNFKNYLIKNFVGSYETVFSSKILKYKNLEIKLRDDFTTGNKEKTNFEKKIYSYSNNRIEAWKFLIQMFVNNSLNIEMDNKLIKDGYKLDEFNIINKKNYLTGYGPQYDRYLLYNNSKANTSEVSIGPFGHHASNGLIYSLICSGIVGMLVFIFLNLVILYRLIKIILHNGLKNLNSKPFLTASIFIILFLQFRILFENSYSVYGVDLIIFLSSCLIINRSYKKTNNVKI